MADPIKHPGSSISDLPLRRGLAVLIGLLLAGAVFVVYHPVVNGTFLWDDGFLVPYNPFIKSPVLGLEVFRHFLFPDSQNEFYRPVQNLTYIADYWRAGLDASAYHQTNLLIHSLNGILLFFLSRRLIGFFTDISSNVVTALALVLTLGWLLHPVHSAIAAYISGRADSLALAGLLAGWLCWEKTISRVNSGDGLRRSGFLFAAVFALIGCCSKEIATAGLGFFVLYLWILRKDLTTATRGKSTLAVLAIFGAYLALRHLPDPNAVAGGGPHFTWLQKIELFFRAMGDYARLFTYPKQLFMERQVVFPTGLFTDPVKSDPLFPYLGWLGGVFLFALFASLAWKGKGHHLRLLGTLWFLIMILPVSNLISLNASVAEHWLYIPSIGLCFWLMGCGVELGKVSRRIMLVIAVLAVVCFGVRANRRAEDWKDGITFYQATIRDGGDSMRMRINLAAEYRKLGRLDEVEKIYRSVLLARPGYSWVEGLLAQNLLAQGRGEEASALLKSPSQKTQGQLSERVVLIDYLTKTGRYPEATEICRNAYQDHPDSWAMAKALASIYHAQNQSRASLQIVKGFAARNWWHGESQNELGSLYAELNQPGEAVKAYLNASRLDIRDAEPLNKAAALLGDSGNFAAAIALQQKAVRRDGGPRQRALLKSMEKLASENKPST